MKYQITKKFLSGLLKGLSITEVTGVKFEIGKVYTAAITKDRYEITLVMPA